MEDPVRFLIIDGHSEKADSLRGSKWKWKDPPKKTVVALNLENEPVSALRLFDVCLQLSNAPFVALKTIGIGGVYTREDYRGRQIASRMINFVTAQIHGDSPNWDVTGFTLYSRERSLYLRCGFKKIGVYRTQVLMYWPIVSCIEVFESGYWETIPERF